jgi:hypothetical protein
MIDSNIKVKISLNLTLALLILAHPVSPAVAQEIELDSALQAPRIYRSPEERREAGLGTELTSWLKASGLIEIEYEKIDLLNREDSADDQSEEDIVYNGQLGIEIEFSEKITAEVTVEVEHEERSHTFLDEAVLIIDLDPVEIELGRISLPFGEYYSHFVTGPTLEFGETLAEGIVLAYAIHDNIELSAYSFASKIGSNRRNENLDWGLNLEFVNESEAFKFGLGYLSDLAESDENLLEDFENQSIRKVAALNAYALIGFEPFEITAEYVSAAKAFAEFDPAYDRPSSYNLELAYSVNDHAQLSLRFEENKELEEVPNSQYGVNFTWRPNRYFLFSLEYLEGKFDFIADSEEQEFRSSKLIAAQLAVEF